MNKSISESSSDSLCNSKLHSPDATASDDNVGDNHNNAVDVNNNATAPPSLAQSSSVPIITDHDNAVNRIVEDQNRLINSSTAARNSTSTARTLLTRKVQVSDDDGSIDYDNDNYENNRGYGTVNNSTGSNRNNSTGNPVNKSIGESSSDSLRNSKLHSPDATASDDNVGDNHNNAVDVNNNATAPPSLAQSSSVPIVTEHDNAVNRLINSSTAARNSTGNVTILRKRKSHTPDDDLDQGSRSNHKLLNSSTLSSSVVKNIRDSALTDEFKLTWTRGMVWCTFGFSAPKYDNIENNFALSLIPTSSLSKDSNNFVSVDACQVLNTNFALTVIIMINVTIIHL